MRRGMLAVGLVVGLLALVVAAHMAFIEIGREVVTLRTQRPDGSWQETRLWIVDDDGASFLHSAGERWAKRFDGDPVVEVERGGRVGRYRAVPMPGPHPRIDQLLREKYGVADRWVRFIAPDGEGTLVVRLEPVAP